MARCALSLAHFMPGEALEEHTKSFEDDSGAELKVLPAVILEFMHSRQLSGHSREGNKEFATFEAAVTFLSYQT
jgi:uncharacterized protein YfaT (DUF1175 family)